MTENKGLIQQVAELQEQVTELQSQVDYLTDRVRVLCKNHQLIFDDKEKQKPYKWY